NADEAFVFALRSAKVNNEIAATAGRVMRNLAKGQPIGPEEARAADQEREANAADAALYSEGPGKKGMPGYGEVPNPARAPSARLQSPGRFLAQQYAQLPSDSDTIALPGTVGIPAPVNVAGKGGSGSDKAQD